MKLLSLLPVLFLMSSCYFTTFVPRPAATVGEIRVDISLTFDGHKPHWDHHDIFCCNHYGHYDRTYNSYWHQRYTPDYNIYILDNKSSVKRQKRPNLKMKQKIPVRTKRNLWNSYKKKIN